MGVRLRYAARMQALPETRATRAFERRVARALASHIAADEPLVVACSGGPDSMATLIAVVHTHGAAASVVAAHFDHRLRPASESEADRVAVEALAARLGVRCLSGVAGDALGPSEAAAREARYQWLAEACAEVGAHWCVTGHTLDDQAETVLLRLARGSGLLGVAGMASAASWPVSSGADAPSVVRPLLGLRRAQAASYLAALGVEPRIDPTNALAVFDRNRVRHRVLPELSALNPRVEEALARFAALAREDNDALEAWATREAQTLVRREGGAVLVERAGLRLLPRAVAARVLRQAATELGVQLDAGQVATLLRLAGRAGSRLAIGGGVEVRVEGAVVRFEAGAGGQNR
jgi:tRNA(Ile)-lysidine synthase